MILTPDDKARWKNQLQGVVGLSEEEADELIERLVPLAAALARANAISTEEAIAQVTSKALRERFRAPETDLADLAEERARRITSDMAKWTVHVRMHCPAEGCMGYVDTDRAEASLGIENGVRFLGTPCDSCDRTYTIEAYDDSGWNTGCR